MSRRKARPAKQHRTRTKGPSAMGTCRTCGKQVFKKRQDAKNAAHNRHPYAELSAYACPHGNGYHYGHLPPQVKSGDVDRRDLRPPPGAPQ